MSETDTQPAPSEELDAAREQLIVAEIVDDADEDRVDFDEDFDDDDADEDDEEYERAVIVLREVIERQLIACRTLSAQLTDTATDVTAALVESPAKVIEAVREGTTLPGAVSLTADAVTDAAIQAGSRIRAAVGSYVNSQAALPDALIIGAAEVAGSAIRAQGTVASSAFDAAFMVATTAARGDDVRDAFDEEWQGLLATVSSVRDDVDDTVSAARRRVRDALPVILGAG